MKFGFFAFLAKTMRTYYLGKAADFMQICGTQFL
jgi:hypothetical protein